MTKREFLENLADRISALSEGDIKRSLEYYSEMIDDFVEDGLSEEQAVERLGNMDEIVLQILSEVPLMKIVKKRAKDGKKMSGTTVTLLILGFPLWFPLLIAAFAVLLALYVSLWSVIISLWAVFVALVGSSLGMIVTSVIFMLTSRATSGIAMIGALLVCAGLSILFFFANKIATKGICLLTKKSVLGIKYCFVGKEKK